MYHVYIFYWMAQHRVTWKIGGLVYPKHNLYLNVTIANKLFLWMRAHSGLVKVDTFSSEKVTTLGIFLNMLPDFHHRDDFKTHCVNNIALP